ncbi:ribosome maturation factor RimP [Mycobacterium sp. TNTM28]|uniref:Ribosome maturation factor RimP n=1 Tax=[Mycobacterium] fortunisiensis TaxID=2600579 RepID=A0ABS6KLW2_9MYCO|nr:ribosome maturation factor RimP [[Mycobacterium] fortunisiensis]MBU9764592.1 ribosome maturation factor RimP [[Mycobacterium] fortunisiensis]
MAPDPSLRSADLPSQTQLIELLDGEFARAGYEIDDVVVDTSTRPHRITVIADGDEGLDLDSLAALSRTASDLLDQRIAGETPYVLEVTSPGIHRPLTQAKHFRRARGRKAELTMTDGSVFTGRLGEVDDAVVKVVVPAGRDLAIREVALADIAKAVVQVEFSPPNRRELELSGQTGKGAGE